MDLEMKMSSFYYITVYIFRSFTVRCLKKSTKIIILIQSAHLPKHL